MTQWTKDNAPNWKHLAGMDSRGKIQPIKTAKGWTHPNTGEVLVAIGGLNLEGCSQAVAAQALIQDVLYTTAEYDNGDPLAVNVAFTENVVVTGAPFITLTHSGGTLQLDYDSTATDALRTAGIYNELVFAITDVTAAVVGETFTSLSNIDLNSGTIKDADDTGTVLVPNVVADLTLPDGTNYTAVDFSGITFAAS